MSSRLTIAAVTETLAQIVRDEVGPHVPNLVVTTGASGPKDALALARVDVQLYRVQPSIEVRNVARPTETAGETLRQPQSIALDLHYLVSFHGETRQQMAQQLLALTVLAFHRHAVIGLDATARAIAAVPNGYLDTVDLAAHPNGIWLTPETLSFEELLRASAVTSGGPYALAMAYRCSVVLAANVG